MTDWIDIGALADVPSRGARCLTTPLGKIAIFRTADDRVFAIDDRCPHRGGPLSEGIVHGAQVTCPLHNWVFSLETGEAQGADAGAVRTYPLRLHDNRILIDAQTLRARSAA
ncbi:nitrite reductase small subunit NirD [Devosia sp. PTR5]|jgi:nitrite reductase (NADH) small subunit|uniref:Nitrite reductase small subunit NirD n=1 Tax=Devosia oryzisoli TaxID=2774138 RepID=A0A927FX52_9HYPH|nr:nitrite reductase small subunit NirD [Devosia oryzisoli]MBD8067162.1 nitrite reductase small subunit NirD [Devosia oryzisoli]